MPTIDIYAAGGTFADRHKLPQDLAKAVMKWENILPINLFKKNTAAFIHELASEAISNAGGDSNYVRVQVLTPINVLNREKQFDVIRELTDIVGAAAGDPTMVNRTWMLITEAAEGGWGINRHANTGAEIVAAARAELGNSERTKDS
jgi:phenylpyruvate tautomerase PptA (4-oxalocrotonate tautomerase family)